MKTVSIAFALALLLAASGTAHATPLGDTFCKGAGNPTHLGELVQQSLDKDPTGNTRLDPVACHQANPATPNDFFKMLPASDPDSGVTVVGELPEYLKSLVPVEVTVKYWSACRKFAHGAWYPEANCIARYLHKVEVVWGNPKTLKPVLQGDCSNPIQQPEQPLGCGYIWVRTDAQTNAFRVEQAGPDKLDDQMCKPAILRAGETDYESPWYEECPYVCDFAVVNAQMEAEGFVPQQKGSFVPVPGWQIVRVPLKVMERDSPYLFVFCIETLDRGGSCGKDIRWNDYRNGVAVIAFDSDDHPEKWKGRVRIWHFGLLNCRDEQY